MDKVYYPYCDAATMGRRIHVSLGAAGQDSSVAISDARVARLLLVLSELDECVAGLEQLPNNELSELVSSAIRACGFTDPVEARSAIASVLQAIEAPGSPGTLAL